MLIRSCRVQSCHEDSLGLLRDGSSTVGLVMCGSPEACW